MTASEVPHETAPFEMPDWHAEVLEERFRKGEEGRAEWYTIDEVEEQRARSTQPER